MLHLHMSISLSPLLFHDFFLKFLQYNWLDGHLLSRRICLYYPKRGLLLRLNFIPETFCDACLCSAALHIYARSNKQSCVSFERLQNISFDVSLNRNIVDPDSLLELGAYMTLYSQFNVRRLLYNILEWAILKLSQYFRGV